MDNRANYTLTGLFVVALAVAAVALGLWIAGELRQGDTRLYTVYLEEPVSGLSESSTVLLQGVPVGKLRHLALDPEDPQRVRLTLELAADAPVREDTEAVLRTHGATGMMRLELEGGSREAGPPVRPEGEDHPVIRSRPSFWARIDGSVDEGLETFSKLARQLDRLLDDENMEAISASLHNLRDVSDAFARNTDNLDRAMEGAASMAETMSLLESRLPATLDRLDEGLLAVEGMGRRLEETGGELSRVARTGEQGLERFQRQTLPEMDALVLELRQLSLSLQRLGDELDEHPEMLIFGRPELEPGPGE